MQNDDNEDSVFEKSKAREIIQAILDYGIKNSQIYDMIRLLAMELENIDHMKNIVSVVESLQEQPKSRILTKE